MAVPNCQLPCGKCGQRTTKLPGIIVDGGVVGKAYHVCWSCSISKEEGKSSAWRAIASKGKGPIWKKHTATHWQTDVNGNLLDYWPTKRKWRFDGQTHVGDVNKFIRGLK